MGKRHRFGKKKKERDKTRERKANLSLHGLYIVKQTVDSVDLFQLLNRSCSSAESLRERCPFPWQQSAEGIPWLAAGMTQQSSQAEPGLMERDPMTSDRGKGMLPTRAALASATFMWKLLKGYYLKDKCPFSNEMKLDGNSRPSATAEVKASGAGLLEALGFL